MSLRSRLALRRRLESIIGRSRTESISKAYDWAFADALTALANKYGSDKGNRAFNRHYYTQSYHRLFAHLRNRPITLLEIGLRHPEEHRDAVAPSLCMWRDYFPYAQLIGFDIADFSNVSLSHCRILQGDMSSREDLSRLFALGPFDIVIDDGSHASMHQQIALACLFPHVTPGGFYLIEDLDWQPPELERADVPQTQILLHRKCFESPVITGAEAKFLAANVESVRLFNGDTLGLLRKTSVAPVRTSG